MSVSPTRLAKYLMDGGRMEKNRSDGGRISWVRLLRESVKHPSGAGGVGEGGQDGTRVAR